MLRVLPEIAGAMANGRPVVALESSVIAQGLPHPTNREAVRRMVDAVARNGAIAAITAVARGTPTVGLEADELERFYNRDGVRKVAARDLAVAIADGADGATTVSASLAIAALAGIQVFATGGIGGVHREAYDESSDLVELARTPIIVVCAGAKSILDLAATSERLETLGVPVIGYRTDELPGFFSASTGIRVMARADTPAQIAATFRAHRALGRPQALLVVQPPPADVALAQDDVELAVTRALGEARAERIQGPALTPFLLEAVTRLTAGASLEANVALLEANAALAGAIAAECCS